MKVFLDWKTLLLAVIAVCCLVYSIVLLAQHKYVEAVAFAWLNGFGLGAFVYKYKPFLSWILLFQNWFKGIKK